MARRKARMPQGKKIQPAPLTMTFTLDVEQATQNRFTIDLSQCASLVSRRFYRQGLQWAVSGFTILAPEGASGSVIIDKIPDTWVASNAWQKGFSSWQKLNNESLEDTESIRPKFLDYKVHMDYLHSLDGKSSNLLPIDANGVEYTEGEWAYSEMVIPLTGPAATNPGQVTTRDIIWTGANYQGAGASGNNSVSLIEGYAASRGLPDILDPNAPADAGDIDGGQPENWIAATENEGTSQKDDVVEQMLVDNNQAPYPYENDGVHIDTMYPGGANQASGLEPHDIVFLTPTVIGGKSFARGGLFSGGLIRINTDTLVADTITLQVHLHPGEHRGYGARPMQEV